MFHVKKIEDYTYGRVSSKNTDVYCKVQQSFNLFVNISHFSPLTIMQAEILIEAGSAESATAEILIEAGSAESATAEILIEAGSAESADTQIVKECRFVWESVRS